MINRKEFCRQLKVMKKEKRILFFIEEKEIIRVYEKSPYFPHIYRFDENDILINPYKELLKDSEKTLEEYVEQKENLEELIKNEQEKIQKIKENIAKNELYGVLKEML